MAAQHLNPGNRVAYFPRDFGSPETSLTREYSLSGVPKSSFACLLRQVSSNRRWKQESCGADRQQVRYRICPPQFWRFDAPRIVALYAFNPESRDRNITRSAGSSRVIVTKYRRRPAKVNILRNESCVGSAEWSLARLQLFENRNMAISYRTDHEAAVRTWKVPQFLRVSARGKRVSCADARVVGSAKKVFRASVLTRRRGTIVESEHLADRPDWKCWIKYSRVRRVMPVPQMATLCFLNRPMEIFVCK